QGAGVGTLSRAQRTGRSPLAAVLEFGADLLETDRHWSIAGRDATAELVLVQTRRYCRTGTSAVDRLMPSSTFSQEGGKCYLEISKTVRNFKELIPLKSRELQFEIQVYEYETVPKGMWNLETHFNFVARGTKEFE